MCWTFGTFYRTIMLENVSLDVVEGARVRGVLGVSVRPRDAGAGKGLSIIPSTVHSPQPTTAPTVQPRTW